MVIGTLIFDVLLSPHLRNQIHDVTDSIGTWFKDPLITRNKVKC